MKKLLVCILAAAIAFSCCGCGLIRKTSEEPLTPVDPNPEKEEPVAAPVFPAGVMVCSTDVSGMTAEEAAAAVAAHAEDYTLSLKVGDETLVFTAKELGLTCGSIDFSGILQGCLEDSTKKDIAVESLIAFDVTRLAAALKVKSGEAAKNASIAYNETTKQFEIVPEEQGGVNVDAVLEAVRLPILMLADKVELDPEKAYQPAELTAESKEVQNALKAANELLAVRLEYTYTPKSGDSATEIIDGTLIATWLILEEDGLTVQIDTAALSEYVTKMGNAHSVAASSSQFKTTGGSYINISVPRAGQTVDTEALYNDILSCLTKHTSGKREAPYAASDDDGGNFGGNYVEVDLSSQHLWVYSGGVCIVSSDIVSGCVNEGHATPTGLFSIQDKQTDTYLVGPDYKSWVNYWMPFYGGVGLHDADGWRYGYYGGSIYLYDGSHGCVNMPYGAAQKTYQNVRVGTRVVVYGGRTSVDPISQSLSGTKSYSVTMGCEPFRLDAAPNYSTTLTYSSDNSSVAKVSSEGIVTVVGTGTATITVTAKEKPGYSSATMKVTVTVQSKCAAGDHTWDAGKVTSESTCAVQGVRTYTCTACGATKTEALPLADHVWDSGTQTTAPTCGADGEMSYHCQNCGTGRTEVIPATGLHTYEGGTCTGCGAKDPAWVDPGSEPEKPDPEGNGE